MFFLEIDPSMVISTISTDKSNLDKNGQSLQRIME